MNALGDDVGVGRNGQSESVRPRIVAVFVIVLILAARLLQGSEVHTATPEWLPRSVARWWPDITKAADAHGVDPELVAIVMLVESGGDPNARSSAGALGLMQVVPRFHPKLVAAGADPFEPDHNIDVGVSILADNIRTCAVSSGDLRLGTITRAAARYNGGTCTADRNFAETRRYVRLVGGMWSERRLPSSETYDDWAGMWR